MVKTIVDKKKVLKVKKREPETASNRRKRQLSRRFDKLKVNDANKEGILHIGHLPKGFNEPELKKFFSQYGDIKKLRVARSQKTARSKGFAFIQFAEPKVAEIAAKSMHKYMIFGRTLSVTKVEDAHPEMFKHGNRDWKFVPTQLMQRNKINKEEKSDEQRKARVTGLLQKEKERRDRLKELQIDYDFPGFAALVSKPSKSSDKKAKQAAVPEKVKQAAVPEKVKQAAVPEKVKQAAVPEKVKQAAMPEKVKQVTVPEKTKQAAVPTPKAQKEQPKKVQEPVAQKPSKKHDKKVAEEPVVHSKKSKAKIPEPVVSKHAPKKISKKSKK